MFIRYKAIRQWHTKGGSLAVSCTESGLCSSSSWPGLRGIRRTLRRALGFEAGARRDGVRVCRRNRSEIRVGAAWITGRWRCVCGTRLVLGLVVVVVGVLIVALVALNAHVSGECRYGLASPSSSYDPSCPSCACRACDDGRASCDGGGGACRCIS